MENMDRLFDEHYDSILENSEVSKWSSMDSFVSKNDRLSNINAPVAQDFFSFISELENEALPICDKDDFEEKCKIGEGATMTVFKSLWKSKNRIVAVKRINLAVPLGASALEVHDEEYKELLKSLVLELRVMTHPWFKSHPNFVDLLAVSWEVAECANELLMAYRPSLIVELADEETPTLMHFVENRREELLNGSLQDLAFNLLCDVAEGMAILNGFKVVHGDLKPQNILLFKAPLRLIAKISDFGFCSPFVDSRTRIGGTLYWNAPECLRSAPEDLKPFSKTITRDLYSYGLLMWYTLFGFLPFGPEDHTSEADIVEWKLVKGLATQLREQVVARAPVLKKLSSPLLESLDEDLDPSSLLWFQIWNSMHELLKIRPNERDMALAFVHLVLKAPKNKDEIFIFQKIRAQKFQYGSRHDQSSGLSVTRPSSGQWLHEHTAHNVLGKYNPIGLERFPVRLQSLIVKTWEEDLSSLGKNSHDYGELCVVLALCYREGIGGEVKVSEAFQLELDGAKSGNVPCQISALLHAVFQGLHLPIKETVELEWLLNGLIWFLLPSERYRAESEVNPKAGKLRSALGAIPKDCRKTALFHGFKWSALTFWEIEYGYFDDAESDPFFSMVINGDIKGLKNSLNQNPELVYSRKGGFTLLHVAADYCQSEIIRELVQTYNLSPNTPSDDGFFPIELATMTGSLETVLLLISLGAETDLLADQETFTSVAFTGARYNETYRQGKNIAQFLQLLCEIVRDLHTEGKRPGDPEVAVKNLLNGRYQVPEDEIGACGTPLELCITMSQYESVVGLLQLGADPNVFNSIPPLHAAVSVRDPILTALLLAYGADPNLKANRDYDEGTALHLTDTTSLTAFYESPRSVPINYESALPEGVDPIDTNSLQAIEMRVKACISVLLHFGADIEARNCNDETALMLRIKDGDSEIAKFLQACGAVFDESLEEGSLSARGYGVKAMEKVLASISISEVECEPGQEQAHLHNS